MYKFIYSLMHLHYLGNARVGSSKARQTIEIVADNTCFGEEMLMRVYQKLFM